jgi:predicted MPP superfamily phosphohydrolase
MVWSSLPSPIEWGCGLLLFFSPLICRWPLRQVSSRGARRLKQVLELPLGLLPTWWLLTVVLDLARLFGLSNSAAVLLLALGLFFATLRGLWQIQPRWVVHQRVLEGLSSPISIAQITDVHIGSRDPAFLAQLVRQVNQAAPDLLVITGDFIDQAGISVEQLASLRGLSMPTYFVSGNHERYEDWDQILMRLDELGVTVLDNRVVKIREDLELIGIEDADVEEQVGLQLKRLKVAADQCSILLYHRPSGLEAAAEHGIALTMSGHTHAGQITPFGWLVGRVFSRVKGWSRTGDCWHYVSEGTGTWGPALRLGTRAEMTMFELKPSAQ